MNLTEAKGMDDTDKVIERYYINDKFNVKYPEFIIDDHSTYHHLTDFKSPKAKQLYLKYEQMEEYKRSLLNELLQVRYVPSLLVQMRVFRH